MRRVRIADLKARLSAHLKHVRAGHTVTVLDRETPIARIVPYTAESLEVRRATQSHVAWQVPPVSRTPTDSLAVLIDDRHTR